MSLTRKILFLLVFFILLNIYSIYGFDYDYYFEKKGDTISFVKNDENFVSKIMNSFKNEEEHKLFEFTLEKKSGIVEMNGIFPNENDAHKIADLLDVNREGDYKFEDNVIIDEQLISELTKLIPSFKDFFSDNSKIVVANKEVILTGELKDPNYKDLLNTIISRMNIDIKNEISEEIKKEIKEEILASNNEDEKVEEIKNEVVVIQQKIDELQSKINNLLQERKITFERRSTELTIDSKSVVEDIAKILNEYPTFNLEVAGHTDSRGNDDLNKKISQDRANSVKKLLISFGVNEDRIKAVGYGEEFPIAQDDENGLSEINRRVEFNILGE
jgi:outer membrane protein OmpA-like peptidoglycan-associated protein